MAVPLVCLPALAAGRWASQDREGGKCGGLYQLQLSALCLAAISAPLPSFPQALTPSDPTRPAAVSADAGQCLAVALDLLDSCSACTRASHSVAEPSVHLCSGCWEILHLFREICWAPCRPGAGLGKARSLPFRSFQSNLKGAGKALKRDWGRTGRWHGLGSSDPN